MPIDTCSKKKESLKNLFLIKRGQTVVSQSQLPHSRGIPTCFCTFAPPRNIQAIREEILCARKPMRSKNNFRGITMGWGPIAIWGSNCLTFMCSCRNTVSTKKASLVFFVLFRKRYEHYMNKKEVNLKCVVFFQSSSAIWSLMTKIKKYRWILAALIWVNMVYVCVV